MSFGPKFVNKVENLSVGTYAFQEKRGEKIWKHVRGLKIKKNPFKNT